MIGKVPHATKEEIDRILRFLIAGLKRTFAGAATRHHISNDYGNDGHNNDQSHRTLHGLQS